MEKDCVPESFITSTINRISVDSGSCWCRGQLKEIYSTEHARFWQRYGLVSLNSAVSGESQEHLTLLKYNKVDRFPEPTRPTDNC